MKQSSSDNKTLFLLVGILVFVLLGAFYYYVIYPKNETKRATEQSVEQLQAETSALEKQVAQLGEKEIVLTDDFELRKKLPKSRELDNLLRTVNEVELISEAKIVSISFNNYDEEVATSGTFANEEEASEEETATETDEEVEENTEVVDEKPVTLIDVATLPEQLKLITLSIDMMVLDYDQLLVFLEEIESIERVVRIDSVDFVQSGEAEMMQKDPDELIPVTVQLTTFYSEDVVK
ncbi:hypothetical protein ACXYMX_05360 [Sporosarcina sp. CAU 1771]